MKGVWRAGFILEAIQAVLDPASNYANFATVWSKAPGIPFPQPWRTWLMTRHSDIEARTRKLKEYTERWKAQPYKVQPSDSVCTFRPQSVAQSCWEHIAPKHDVIYRISRGMANGTYSTVQITENAPWPQKWTEQFRDIQPGTGVFVEQKGNPHTLEYPSPPICVEDYLYLARTFVLLERCERKGRDWASILPNPASRPVR